MSILLIIYIGFVIVVFLMLSALDVNGFIGISRQRKQEQEYIKKGTNYNPKTLVIVPCKGRDVTLYENLAGIKNQEYRNYKAIAVVDDGKDEALKFIKKAGIDYMISNIKSERASGKVRAIASAINKFANYDVYVVADSDINVDKMWLKRIVEPLVDKHVGISTMFPYFNPVSGFWSRLKLLWGFIGEGLQEKESTRFGWGGSMAFRKELLDKDSFRYFINSEYSISDDICITKIAKRKGLQIAYTKQSQPKVNSDDNYGQFIEWSNRQTALSLLGYHNNLYAGLVFYIAEALLFFSGIFLTLLVSPLFLIFFLHAIQSEIKTYRRAKGKDRFIWILVPLMPLVYLVNLIHASRMKEITWRGRKYQLLN